MKAKLRDLDLASLTQIHILSNTPAYLYKHFRNDPSLRAFAESCSADDLKYFLDYLKKRKRKTGNFDTLLYAVSIALSFKDYGEVRKRLDALNSFDSKWMPQIKQLILGSLKNTQVRTVDFQFRPSNAADWLSRSETNVVTRNLEPKIRVETS